MLPEAGQCISTARVPTGLLCQLLFGLLAPVSRTSGKRDLRDFVSLWERGGGRGGDGLVSDPVVFFAVADFVLLPLLLTPISPDWGLSAPWKHMPQKTITSIPPFPTKAHFLQLSSHLPSSFPTRFPVGPSCLRSQSLFCIVLCPPYSSSVYSCFSFLCHFNSISLFSLTDQRDSLVMWLKTPLPR